jgi:hypothetical protein
MGLHEPIVRASGAYAATEMQPTGRTEDPQTNYILCVPGFFTIRRFCNDSLRKVAAQYWAFHFGGRGQPETHGNLCKKRTTCELTHGKRMDPAPCELPSEDDTSTLSRERLRCFFFSLATHRGWPGRATQTPRYSPSLSKLTSSVLVYDKLCG